MQHSVTVLESVQEAFEHAVLYSCGVEYVELMRSDCKVKLVKVVSAYSKGGDLDTTCATRIFHNHIARNKTAHMNVKTCSEYGIKREMTYKSVYEVAKAIVSCLPEEKMVVVIADTTIMDKKGLITITTSGHMRWMTSEDRHPCPTCGKFFQGTFGLRTHQVSTHKIATDDARSKALSNSLQIILYTGGGILPQTQMEADTVCVSSATPNPNRVPGADKDSSNGAAAPIEAAIAAAGKGDLEALRRILMPSSRSEDKEYKDGSVAESTSNDHMHQVASGVEELSASTVSKELMDSKDKDSNSLLSWAAGGGHLPVCQYLVEECGMCVVEKGGKKGRHRQPLHWAARNGHVHVCAWLVITKGVAIDVVTDNGTTPLHFAIFQGHLDCVKWLVEVGGCDVNKLNAYGCNAGHWSAFNGSVDILRYLQSKGLNLFHINHNKRSPLHKAAVKGHAAACEWLLAPVELGGGGLDERHMGPEKEGDTPMTLARFFGKLDLEAYLICKYNEFTSRRHGTSSVDT